ncbi:MAG: UvrD-helicase domain-containing protein [Christensenellales bacterium]
MPKWTDQQRDAIADRGHSLIVCAAAGSGKTAVLVERIVQLVREGCPIENMLVVTFTNAAAGEMRQRIGEALSRAAREEPALGEQVMALFRASISTLHRFCGSLLREHFQALAIDPGCITTSRSAACSADRRWGRITQKSAATRFLRRTGAMRRRSWANWRLSSIAS